MTYPNHKQPRGVVSLLALILMTTLTAAALAASTIILAELRQTETFDQSVVAVYAAEAGVEDALHIVKLNRQNPNRTFGATVSDLACDTGAPCPSSEDVRTTMGNGAVWTRTAEQDEQFRVARLEPEQSAHLDLFNPDPGAVGGGVAALDVDWTDTCQGYEDDHGYSILEVTMLFWDAADFTFDPASQQVFKHTQPCNYVVDPATDVGRCTPFRITAVDGHTIDPDQFYRFQFRVFPRGPYSGTESCTIQDLNVTAYMEDGRTIVRTPARLTVKATGAFGSSQQALTASVPWRAPVTGLLNYVLFSEEALDVRK